MTTPELPDELDGEITLPTYVVLARFRRPGPEKEAQDALAEQLRELGLDVDLRVERQEQDATLLLEARLPTVGLDAQTAVAGTYETLDTGGLQPDEVWAQP